MNRVNPPKIFNDPVYGFVQVPKSLLPLVDHPWFQRLRRIAQVGLTHYVYPGALHTRFHHALGALHLMQEAITTLRQKGVPISQEDATGAMVAILLHDIGHGPSSHALEHSLISVSHETLSLAFMETLAETYPELLKPAIPIFTGKHPQPFLHQLVSGQLDLDRMDYLNRDSFFTGVSEGVIGYDRIIKMLTISENHQLLVEEKGVHSIEKFLIARRLMYWQVYLHKTSLAAEYMLMQSLRRARHLAQSGAEVPCSPALQFFLDHPIDEATFHANRTEILQRFALLDDIDLFSSLKMWRIHPDRVLAYLANGILDRQLLALHLDKDPQVIQQKYIQAKSALQNAWGWTEEEMEYVLFQGTEQNRVYKSGTTGADIHFLMKDGTIKALHQVLDHLDTPIITKHYVAYPKSIAS